MLWPNNAGNKRLTCSFRNNCLKTSRMALSNNNFNMINSAFSDAESSDDDDSYKSITSVNSFDCKNEFNILNDVDEDDRPIEKDLLREITNFMEPNYIGDSAAVEKECKAFENGRMFSCDDSSFSYSIKEIGEGEICCIKGEENVLPSQKRFEKYIEKYQPFIREYGRCRSQDESALILLKHPYLVAKNSIVYLMSWCVDLHFQGKYFLEENVVKQSIYLRGILKSLEFSSDDDIQIAVKQFFNMTKNDTSFKLQDILHSELDDLDSKVGKSHSTFYSEGADSYHQLPMSFKMIMKKSGQEENFKRVLKSMSKERAMYYIQKCQNAGIISALKDTSMMNHCFAWPMKQLIIGVVVISALYQFGQFIYMIF